MRSRTVTRSTMTRVDTDKLEALRAQLEAAKGSYCKVGLLGKDADRGETEPGKITHNPSLGKVHELGSASAEPPVPRRSFLKASAQ